MKLEIKKIMAVLLIAGIASSSAFADEAKKKKKNFKEKHPRRAEVIGRANNEEAKNAKAEASGKITEGQESKLNRQDQKIKREEERDAKAHGGTITKAEQNKLNREENTVNRERTNMEKNNAAKAAVQATPSVPSTGN